MLANLGSSCSVTYNLSSEVGINYLVKEVWTLGMGRYREECEKHERTKKRVCSLQRHAHDTAEGGMLNTGESSIMGVNSWFSTFPKTPFKILQCGISLP